MTTKMCHYPFKTCPGMWRLSLLFARLWKLTFLSCILFPLLSPNIVNNSCLTYSFFKFNSIVELCVLMILLLQSTQPNVLQMQVFCWQGLMILQNTSCRVWCCNSPGVTQCYPQQAVEYETDPILQGGGKGLVHDGGSHGRDGGHSHRWQDFKYFCTNWQRPSRKERLGDKNTLPQVTNIHIFLSQLTASLLLFSLTKISPNL